MGGLRIILFLLLGSSTMAQAQGVPWSPSERVQLFATCAGRYSALAEHQRFFDGSASERAEAMQEIFEELIDATLPAAMDWGMPGRQALDWRITAKMATASLLNSANFGTNTRRREIDGAAAEAYLDECQRLVLGDAPA
ncbi:hypothetical protein [Shimia ponticola]|uniref:hypothetical protein n=1 Tax=Shimia ponticola TaxID=2582893 RepID=UPI0011BFCF6B|nr:hypothetical protein [Shimia ponticola]